MTKNRSIVDCGQLVLRCQPDDQIVMNECQRALCNDQSAIRGACEGRDTALDLRRITHVDGAYIHTEGRRHGLNRAELAGPGTWQDREGLPLGSRAAPSL